MMGANLFGLGGPAPASPFMQQQGANGDKRAALEALLSGATPEVRRMLSQWVLTHRPQWDLTQISSRPVSIGERMEALTPGRTLPVNLTVPMLTAFYGLAITTRDDVGTLVRSCTDLMFQVKTKSGTYVFGSSSHRCPVAPFDPTGSGFRHMAPFLVGDGDRLKFEVSNESSTRTFDIVFNVLGLGVTTPTGSNG